MPRRGMGPAHPAPRGRGASTPLLLLVLLGAMGTGPSSARLTDIGSRKTGMNAHEQQRRLVDDNDIQVCAADRPCPPPSPRELAFSKH